VVTLRDYWPVRLDGIAWPDQVEGQGQEVAWTARALRESFGLPPWLARVAAPRARRRLLRRQEALGACSRIVCVSDAVRRRVAPALEPACEVIPNMIDADEAARRAAGFDPPREPGSYLFAAGKLNSMKGFDALVDELAAAGWKGRVVIAGGGPLQAAIREQAAAAGLAVELLGWTGADELMGWMAQARAVLVPSAWEEPLARVILEAQALAVPVVARATGGSTDAIDHGVTGFLYQGTDDLAGSLTTLSDDAQAASIGAAGAQVCRERYAPDVVVRRVEGVYAEAMQSRKRDG
jgi:glycosyltransferase involved in cell wall biosynthesis